MTQLLTLLETHATGAFVILAFLAAGVFLLQWIMWIFGRGRFKRDGDASPVVGTQNLRYLITEALTKIINDFRHLLALLIVLIFGLALAYALYQAGGNIDEIKEALQAVTATLGGLVGSIIGYYFGESKAQAAAAQGSPTNKPTPVAEQKPNPGPGGANNTIVPVTRPADTGGTVSGDNAGGP
jgi:hypothetical protein